MGDTPPSPSGVDNTSNPEKTTTSGGTKIGDTVHKIDIDLTPQKENTRNNNTPPTDNNNNNNNSNNNCIISVVVYEDRAEIVRQFSNLTVKPGQNEIAIKGLVTGIDRDSIR